MTVHSLNKQFQICSQCLHTRCLDQSVCLSLTDPDVQEVFTDSGVCRQQTQHLYCTLKTRCVMTKILHLVKMTKVEKKSISKAG